MCPGQSDREVDDGHAAVSFDVEIAVATSALGAALEKRVNDITDAALLSAFVAELTTASLTAPAGLSVRKNPAAVAKATTDSNLGAILGGIIGGLIVIGGLYYYFRVYKPNHAAPPAPKNVQQAEMTPVAGALTTKGAAPAPVSTV